MKTSGLAVHGGGICHVTLHRVDGGPVTFMRGARRVPATVHNVVSTNRATSLGAGGAVVHMVEHLLAALRAHGFYGGVLVEASQDELPILDGSAAGWLPAVLELGTPPPPPRPVRPAAPISVSARGGTATVTPGAERLSVRIEFDHPAIGVQEWSGGPTEYGNLLEARTFGMAAEWEELKLRGLATGLTAEIASEHAIVFDDVAAITPLRDPVEPAMHKALDALGDLALLGAPLHADVRVVRGSHELHHALTTAIAASLAARASGAPASSGVSSESSPS